MEKYQGFWPLPGGIENYVDTLQRALSFMRDSRPSEEELAKWFVTNFQKVHVGSARGYIRVALRHSGLVDYDKKKHLLSKAGEDYLAKPDNFLLFRVLDANVLGFRETLEIISEREPEMQQLGKELARKLGMDWRKATAQPYWRVNWLRSMGFVTLEEKKLKLTQAGIQLLESSPQAVESKPLTQRIETKQLLEEGEPVLVPLSPKTREVIKNLQETQHLSEDPSRFEEAIAQAFDLLGFSSEQLGKSGETDVFAKAHLGEGSYSIVIDGKTTRADRISEKQISWPSLTEHKESRSADFIAVVAPSFAGGDLIQRAKQFGVSLIDTETLIGLLEIHDKTPLDLDNLRELFQRKGLVRLEDCSDLMTSKAEYEKQQKLVPGILESLYRLQREGEPTHASDIRWALAREFEQEDVLETLDLLEKWGFVKRVGEDHWIALMSSRVAAQRLRAIADSFKQ